MKKKYKGVNAELEQRAIEAYKRHKQVFEEWQEGDIKEVWLDDRGVLCIRYESGNWWHYEDDGSWW